MSTICLCEVEDDVCYQGSFINNLFADINKVKAIYTVLPTLKSRLGGSLGRSHLMSLG